MSLDLDSSGVRLLERYEIGVEDVTSIMGSRNRSSYSLFGLGVTSTYVLYNRWQQSLLLQSSLHLPAIGVQIKLGIFEFPSFVHE